MYRYKIYYEQLFTAFLAFLLTFVLADICPHPSLAPGLLQSTFTHIQQTIVSE